MTSVAAENIVRTHGTNRVLNGISFEVSSGEMVVLLGPSGCGKSTLLRLIAGLDAPDEGIIRIDGRDMTRIPPAGRAISMVFQSYGLFPHMNVRDNILFGLQVRREPAHEQEKRLKKAVGILKLEPLLARRPAQLSGGQQQRVALARAIVSGRPICLMDEPLSNLDAQLRTSVRREIAELQDTLKLTMVYVTHDQTEALTLADRIVLLQGGNIMQIGAPQALFDQPRNVFAASFIGMPPMNLLTLDSRDRIADLDHYWGSLASALDAHGSIVVGIRPDGLVIDDASGIPAIVAGSEYLGGSCLLNCTVFGQSALVLHAASSTPAPGTKIRLRPIGGADHFFHPTTGDRIS